ncbi:heteromeric transposase endonuclease subunit TnsA [Sporosarcina sp. BI001-red]|uniref:TnsA endonuclease C-terminal domain-containing protein n=1 Tax=Sporosarcina sp. BI001-red TaxID=2282866 RepID=UPI000E2213E4|nr:TnsA endonuclease C-terminal domain-containing protein [Sporosarcina sp. BI001-red]REB11003.1 heteromeric transposase endonuclease subunit TnsA [Sporosarcina sp. BI001-red]
MISSYYENSAKVRKHIKEGRGQGCGIDYVPWTKTHDYSSLGRATRLKGIKIPRIYHLQSDIQYRAFLSYEFSDRVFDIRETYPLLDVMEIVDSKDNLRFDKFCDKETNEPYVITTNFLLSVKDKSGKECLVARTVKNTTELKRKLTWEKLEIERRYWKALDIDWKIITDRELPRQVSKNIEWIRETLLDTDILTTEKKEMANSLCQDINTDLDLPIKNILKIFDEKMLLSKGTGLYLFRYLLATKEIKVNMNKPIILSNSVRDLTHEA